MLHLAAPVMLVIAVGDFLVFKLCCSSVEEQYSCQFNHNRPYCTWNFSWSLLLFFFSFWLMFFHCPLLVRSRCYCLLCTEFLCTYSSFVHVVYIFGWEKTCSQLAFQCILKVFRMIEVRVLFRPHKLLHTTLFKPCLLPQTAVTRFEANSLKYLSILWPHTFGHKVCVMVRIPQNICHIVLYIAHVMCHQEWEEKI